MSGPETLHFLFDENDNCLKVVDGLVIASPDLAPLQFTPSGWQDISIQNVRNSKYFAMDRSFTVPLDFVEDGAQILKDRYYKKGIEEKVFLVIMKQQLYIDATHYGYYYTLLYRGEIDFSQMKHIGEKVTVNIMEGGAVKYLKANENIKYEIPIEVTEAIKIKMDGILLKEKGLFSMIDGLELSPIPINGNADFTMPVIFLRREGSFPGVEFLSQNYERLTPNYFDYLQNSLNYFTGKTAKTSLPVQMTISGTLQFACTQNNGYSSGSGGFKMFMVQTNRNATPGTILTTPSSAAEVYDSGLLQPGVTYTVNLNETFTLNNNDNIFFNGKFGYIGGLNGIKIEFFPGSDFSVSFTSKIDTTYIKALRPKYLYEQLTNKLSDGTVQAESNALETYKSFVVTSGDAIRGLTGAVIKSSISDFFQSYNAVLSIGMGNVSSKLKLERKPDWIDNTNTIDLGEGKELSVSSATDLLFNSLKIGYPEQDYDDVNGKEEFNNTHVYTAPVTRLNKELDLTSVYRADCYGIEFTRINLEGKTTTDNSSDNDVFIIHIKDTPIIDPVEGEVYELDRELNQYATGLLTPETVFNLALSPKQCLLRNGQYLRSCFYKQDTGYLKFQTTEKNSSLSVAAPSGTVTENADIEIAMLGDRLFVPILLEFETRVPVNLLELLDVNPLTSFLTSYLTASLKGVPVKTGIKPEDMDSQTYQLLASPDTDLEELINIFE